MRRYFISFSRFERDSEVVTQNVVQADNVLQAFVACGINFRDGKAREKVMCVYSEEL